MERVETTCDRAERSADGKWKERCCPVPSTALESSFLLSLYFKQCTEVGPSTIVLGKT